jgi:hypothetical protein
MGQIPKQRKLNELGGKGITALLDLGFPALGLQLVPLRPESAVVGVQHLGQGHLDLAEDVVGEVPVLLDHRDEELVPEVPDPEGELLVPGGAQRPARRPGLGPLLPQPRPGVGVPQPVAGVRRRETAGLHHAHQQPHFLAPEALGLLRSPPKNSILGVRFQSNQSNEEPTITSGHIPFSTPLSLLYRIENLAARSNQTNYEQNGVIPRGKKSVCPGQETRRREQMNGIASNNQPIGISNPTNRGRTALHPGSKKPPFTTKQQSNRSTEGKKNLPKIRNEKGRAGNETARRADVEQGLGWEELLPLGD